MFQTLKNLVRFYAEHQVERIYIKLLAANDNSKNQVYFGPGFKALTLFPMGDIVPAPNGANPIFKATVDFSWIGEDHTLVTAPTAQVILYPQYPEIRFSGFLKGADRSRLEQTRNLMAARIPGRVLFLGTTTSGKIIGNVFDPDSDIAREFATATESLQKASEVFYELHPAVFLGNRITPRRKLLEELCRIHKLGWINSKRLDGAGNILPCTASQCGGYTLEAELGITPNSRSEPDYLGWEVKQHSGNVLTLMTPEPTGGFYVDAGVEAFLRTFGYPDRNGVADRINFGGTHFCNTRHQLTGLMMKLDGYDSATNRITSQYGGISLVSDTGVIAASWAFTGILDHWNRKHRNAVYVSSEHRIAPANQYRYGDTVQMGEGTDPLLLVKAIHAGKVYYDPGIKLENSSQNNPRMKRRSQFRVKLKDLNSLYESTKDENLSNYC